MFERAATAIPFLAPPAHWILAGDERAAAELGSAACR